MVRRDAGTACRVPRMRRPRGARRTRRRQARVSGECGAGAGGRARPAAVLSVTRSNTRCGACSRPCISLEHRFPEAVREGERLRDAVPARPLELRRHRRRTPRARRLRSRVRGLSADVGFPPARDGDPARLLRARTPGPPRCRLDATRPAADATAPRDPESLAWHHAQIAGLLFQMGLAKLSADGIRPGATHSGRTIQPRSSDWAG